MPSTIAVIQKAGHGICRQKRLAVIAAAVLGLAGCHGGTLDAVYPGTLGHEPPPAVNLPPQDAGMGMTVQPSRTVKGRLTRMST